MSANPLVKLRVLFVVITSLAISACAVDSHRPDAQDKAAEVMPVKKQDFPHSVQTKSEPVHQELTGELLYDLLLAELALQRNNYELAFEKYYAAAAATQDDRLAKKATRVTLFSKNDKQTFKAVELWSKIQPENIDVQQIYASSLISQKQDKQAVIHLNKVIQLSDSFDNGFKRAVAIIDTVDDQKRAVWLYNQVSAGHDDNIVVTLYRAKIAFKFVDYPKTEKYLNELLLIQPDHADALLLKVELLKKQKKIQQAIQVLQKIVYKLPDNIVLRLELSRLLVKNKNYERAAEQIKILSKKELSPEVLFAISLLTIEMDKIDEAKVYLERLYTYRLYASESAYFIARLEAGRKNYAEAEHWFKRVKNGKYTFEAYLGLVLVYAQQKKFDQAFKLLEHSRGSNSKQGVEILQIKAEVYIQAKNYTKAYEIYTEALTLAADNHDIRYGRAMLSEKMDRLDLFEQDLHIILKENPKDSQTLNALGYVLADKTSRYQEARQYIEQALAINPDDVATLDSMGWVLYKMGEPGKALNYLKRAYEKGSDAEIAAHYGEVLWVTGQTRKAKIIWDKALKNDPEHHVLIGIMSQYLNKDDQ